MTAATHEPLNVDAASALLAQCSADSRPVRLLGANTWPAAYNRDGTNAGDFTTISARAMRGVNDYEPEDLTVSVAAGTTLEELAAALRVNNQWLALDPPALPGATVGGLVATASAGPLRARYGTPRDQVLGVDIITGDGRALHFGGNVVKNVAGYDITRPIVGSRGTLGLITRVSLRLRPLPAADETWAVPAASIEACLRLADVIDSSWPLAALEIVSANLAIAAGVPFGTDPGTRWVILARIQGHQKEIAEAAARIGSAIRGAYGVAALTAVPAASAVWRRLGESEASAATYLRLAARVTDLPFTLKVAKSLADRALADAPCIAVHAATGIVRTWGEPDTTTLATAVEQAATDMLSADGTVSWNGVPAAVKQQSDARRDQIEQSIRAIFDPAGILRGTAS